MKRFLLLLLAPPLLSLLVTPAWGQLKIKGETTVVKVARIITVYDERQAIKSFPFVVEAPEDAFRTEWIVPPNVAANRRGRILEITNAPKGELTIEANWGVIKTGEEKSDKVTLVIGDSAPSPPDPKPPTPDPPKPPPINPAPIPVAGFRVLIVYESSTGAPLLTQKQQNELYGVELKKYLDEKCVRVNNLPEWRIWDKDVPLTSASQLWKTAMGRSRTQVPWIVISDGVTGYEGPLPDGDILAFIRKYGG